MTAGKRAKTLIFIIISAIASLAVGFGVGRASKREEPRGAPRDAAPERTFSLPEDLAKRAKLGTARAQTITLAPTLDLVGSVEFDQDQVADVGSRTTGRVTRLLVTLGQEVRAGDPLCELESAELGHVLADLIAARARLTAARAHENREQLLEREQLTAAASVEQARANATAVSAEARSAEQRLFALGLSRDEIEAAASRGVAPRIVLRAPIAGQVVSRNVFLGQVVDPTHAVMRIANVDRLWVLLDVFERDLSRVRTGNRVEIRSESYPGQVFRGVVSHVEATVDVETRASRVRIAVENTDRLLRPGQFVRATLLSDGQSRNALAVPRRAVTILDGVSTVFLAHGRNRFEVRAIELGATQGDLTEVVRGLAENDTVVVEGVFALKSERER